MFSPCLNKSFHAGIFAHTFSTLHARLYHLSTHTMSKLSIPYKLNNTIDFYYEPWIFVKFHNTPSPVSTSHTGALFQLINGDRWGPYRQASLT